MRVPAALLALSAAVACGRDPDRVAAAIRRDLARDLGVAIARVTCRGPQCEAVTAAGLRIPVTVTSRRPLAWETVDLIDPAPIAAEVRAALVSVGAAQAIDCGALRLASAGGDRVECALAGGGVALVEVAADGTLDVELALTAAIAATRRAPPDDAALERQSRALDTDEAEGEEPDGDGADTIDAGVDAVTPTSGG